MSTHDERVQILEMIDSGKISPSEGLALLKALDANEPVLPEAASVEQAEGSQPLDLTSALAPDLDHQEMAAPVNVPQFTETVQELPAESEASGAWEAQEREATVSPDEPSHGETVASTGEARGPQVEGEVLPPPTIGPDFARWRSFWQIPLWIGVGITVLSSVLMFLAWQSRGFGLLFACTWFPFLFGVAVLAIAWGTRNLPWLHVRIQQKPGERPQRISISLPLPLGLIRWGLRTFKHKIPNTGNVNLDEMVMALKDVSPEAPFSVNVDEGEDGEKVQIYIG